MIQFIMINLALISKWVIGISSILYLIFTTQYLKDQKLSNFEYYIILLTSIFGFFLLCGVNDLITAYLAIELQGLAFYVLASFKKSSNFSIESGVKYFVLGSLSTALFLLGATFLYGLSGSIILTDFKDFFIWVFSTNSFFLSFELVSQALESFQEKMFLNEDINLTKLQVMSDKLNLLGKNVYFSNEEVAFLKPVFENFGIKNDYLNKTELVTSVVEKFLKYYNDSNSHSVLDLNVNTKFVTNENFLRISAFVSSINDFFIENSYQNASVELLYVLQDNQLDYENFVNFKNYLLEANYYEDEELENFYGVSNEESLLIENSSNILKVNDCLIGNQCFYNIYNLLECCYFSDCITNILQFTDFLEDTSSKEVPTVFPDEFVIVEPKTEPTFNGVFDNVFATQYHMASIINILNINTFFLESLEKSSAVSSSAFDLSFVLSGLLIIILALFFKLALAPFHLWAPDVYEGSPSSSTFFFMVISKFGIFVFLLRLCYSSFYSLISYWQFYSIIVATVSIFVGAVAGLKQRKLKSLLTYSSINNMGFVLLAFSVGGFEGVQVKFYYLIVYMLASFCLWSIVLNLQLKKKAYSEKQNRDLGDLALLQESNNVVAQGLGISLFSLAGLPPMVGFLAKMGVFKALSGVSIYYFSVINILFSVIATFYYLRIIKIIFFENILVGSLYETINSKKTFIINLLTFFLVFLFINPMFLYLYSYKITLFLNKSFF
jgi:NADH:ubiquinone oxidoreductase subunit 2 (subunit N)